MGKKKKLGLVEIHLDQDRKKQLKEVDVTYGSTHMSFVYRGIQVEKVHRWSLSYHIYYFCVLHQHKSNCHYLFALMEHFL